MTMLIKEQELPGGRRVCGEDIKVLIGPGAVCLCSFGREHWPVLFDDIECTHNVCLLNYKEVMGQ